MSRCMCEFETSGGCSGSGVIYCSGCGGDLCVCRACHGQGSIECEGCDFCVDRDGNLFDPYEGDDEDPYHELGGES